MITRRRLTLQIAPMLDMLLIVLFMQFLDIKERAVSLETEANASAASVIEMESQLQASQIAAEVARQEAGQILEQQAAVARILGDVFRMTPDETKKLVTQMKAPGTPALSSAVEDRLKTLTGGSPEPILKHLLTYDEIRKRCDVWELFIDGRNLAHLDTGERERELRVNLDAAEDADIERFSVELETVYRGLPQPKHLVILLFSYDRNTRLTVTEGITAALPSMIDRLNRASSGLTRFEFADQGIRRFSLPDDSDP